MMSGIYFKIIWEERIWWDRAEIKWTVSLRFLKLSNGVKVFIEMFHYTKFFVFF